MTGKEEGEEKEDDEGEEVAPALVTSSARREVCLSARVRACVCRAACSRLAWTCFAASRC